MKEGERNCDQFPANGIEPKPKLLQGSYTEEMGCVILPEYHNRCTLPRAYGESRVSNRSGNLAAVG